MEELEANRLHMGIPNENRWEMHSWEVQGMASQIELTL
jgi:hypothetical protein